MSAGTAGRFGRRIVVAAAVVAAAVVSVVLLSACAAPSASPPSALEGTWVLESFGGTQSLTPADPTVTTELTMKAGKASGNGGVNSFSGTYEAPSAGKLRFGAIASTQMAGPDAAMAQEQKFFSALEKTRAFEINGGKLVLGGLDNETLAVLKPK